MRHAMPAALAAAIVLFVPSVVFAQAPATDYEVTPLTKADVDFYLSIMRAAAAHNAHLSGDDKAAVKLTIQSQKHPPPSLSGSPTAAQMQTMARDAALFGRAATLADYDDEIAKQHGVEQRYDAIKNQVDQVVAQATGMVASCGGNDCAGPMTAAQIERGKRSEIAQKADAPLIRPHLAEIRALKKQIGGFMYEGQ